MDIYNCVRKASAQNRTAENNLGLVMVEKGMWKIIQGVDPTNWDMTGKYS